MAEILLIQDAEGDFRLMMEGFRQFGGGRTLATARTAAEARRSLQAFCDGDTQVGRLRLVILGCSLQSAGGLELIRWMKSSRPLQTLPVVVFLSPDEESEIEEAYRTGVNCVVRKHGDLEIFFRTIEATLDMWLYTVRLPTLLPQEKGALNPLSPTACRPAE